ncbi:NAD+ synthase [Natronoglycomyces albus]|uniref:Glutamine-dependent NAD(+) synthetase n=1 Tax=Natronoglycomyces albus TaxID=2811108 RepID=A0A895XM62_9ACTN|nr:NAD+ synthase [Natronoglycomyces albus]QSB06434.1 NAD+ synthase [Natronoglycomyces albus]
MPILRIALAQTNPVVGDIDGNAEQILNAAERAQAAGVHLLAAGEMSLTGYPVEDLVLRQAFIDAGKRRVTRLAEELGERGCGDVAVVMGYVDSDGPTDPGPRSTHGPRNTLALLQHGEVKFTYFKHHLPNYGVFDEARYFVRGDELTVARIGGVDVAFVICEDMWQDGGPFPAAAQSGAGLIVSINASPYDRSKERTRQQLLARRAQETRAHIAYVNIVGGQDDLVFDGSSTVVDPQGKQVARGRRFVEDFLVTELDLPGPDGLDIANTADNAMTVRYVTLSSDQLPRPGTVAANDVVPELSDTGEIWEALRLGLADYATKNRFASVVLGLSGGIDSALVAALACDAVGAENVWAYAMPTQYSSQHSLDDAADLAKRCGLHFHEVQVQPVVDAFLSEMSLSGLALENLQARVRGTILMSLSNQHGHLVLATGNKSEYAVGYSTLYGDSAGGFAPIKDVPKTTVYELARWRNAQARARGEVEPIPENSIQKPPSAELRPDQLDSDSLPDYEVLDAILEAYIDRDQGRDELVAAGYPVDLVRTVTGLVDGAEYKRRQSAPGTKISAKSFGRDRRLPITNRFRGGLDGNV